MFRNLSHGRHALAAVRVLLSFVFLAFVSHAWAGKITYTIVDYPVNMGDGINGGTDTISGTIITDGTLGSWGQTSHIIGGTLSFTQSSTTYTGSTPGMTGQVGYPDISATATDLLIPTGYDGGIDVWTPQNDIIEIEWQRDTGTPSDAAYVGWVQTLSGTWLADFGFAGAPPTTSASIAANDPWILANGGTPTPEPSAFVLFGAAAAALLAYAWRKRAA
jgi:hypothetical protein